MTPITLDAADEKQIRSNLDIAGNQGLGDIKDGQYESEIENFKNIFLNQPSFYISDVSWKLLMEGKNPDGSSWLPAGYEVFGFVFCVAMPKNELFTLNKIPLTQNQYPYFRIRTIIQSILPVINFDSSITGVNVAGSVSLWGKTPPKTSYPIKIEIDKIAYVDIEIAFENERLREMGLPLLDCLRFGEGSATDPDVANWKEQLPSFGRRFITELEKPPSLNFIPVTQEGAIFGKQRIQTILDEKPGTTISFAIGLDKKSSEADKNRMINPIKFVFKIESLYPIHSFPSTIHKQFNLSMPDNGSEYVTELPCPIPTVC